MTTKAKMIGAGIGAAVVALALAFGISIVLAFPVKWLWNWVCPPVFGLPAISALQAWALSALSSLLLKSHGAKTDSE